MHYLRGLFVETGQADLCGGRVYDETRAKEVSLVCSAHEQDSRARVEIRVTPLPRKCTFSSMYGPLCPCRVLALTGPSCPHRIRRATSTSSFQVIWHCCHNVVERQHACLFRFYLRAPYEPKRIAWQEFFTTSGANQVFSRSGFAIQISRNVQTKATFENGDGSTQVSKSNACHKDQEKK